MPKVPEEQGSLYQTNSLPGVAFPMHQQFGRVGEAAEQAGRSVEEAGQTFNQVQDEISHQKDISDSSSAAVAMTVKHQDMMRKINLSSPDGFIHDPQTGQIVTTDDGSGNQKQRTTADEYYDRANSDYLQAQQAMTPRGAAMFRQSFLPKMGENFNLMQSEGLKKQNAFADQAVSQSQDLVNKGYESSHLPDANPYYVDKYENGAINLRPNLSMFSEDARTFQLWRTRQGPNADGTPGMMDPVAVSKAIQDDGHSHSEGWMKAALNNVLEPDAGRKYKTQVPITSLQQLHNLRDVVEGIDPNSKQLEAKGLPTPHSSMSAEQIDKWRNTLNGYRDQALAVDKSDFELHVHTMTRDSEAGVYPTPDKLFGSPDWQHLMQAAEPLGYSPEKVQEEITPILQKALVSQMGGKQFDLAKENDQPRMLQQKSIEWSKAYQQQAQMTGVKYTADQFNALMGEATKSAQVVLEKDNKEAKEDLAAFAAKPASGAQNLANPGAINYRSWTMHAATDVLSRDGSPFLSQKTLPNGKPLLPSVVDTMTSLTNQKLGQGASVQYLSKGDYEAWANKLTNVPAGQTDAALQALSMPRERGGVGPDVARQMIHQLVTVGKLDPQYEFAQNSKSPIARIAMYNAIESGESSVKSYAQSENGESAKILMQKAQVSLAPQIKVGDMVYGADNPDWVKTKESMIQAHMRIYAANAGSGMSQSAALQATNERLKDQMPEPGVASKPLVQIGPFSFGTKGKALPVMFNDPGMPAQSRANIQANLADQLDPKNFGNTIGKQEFYTPKGNDSASSHITPEYIADHAKGWAAIPGKQGNVYRLYVEGVNTDGSPNGSSKPLMVHGSDGSERYYEVPERVLNKSNNKSSPTPLPTIQGPVKTNENTGTVSVGGISG